VTGFWSRATLALGLVLYGWTMMGIELYLHAAPVPSGPDRGLAIFRRLVMGRAVMAVGGGAVLAALVLVVLALSRPRHRASALAALILGLGWLGCLAALWPI